MRCIHTNSQGFKHKFPKRAHIGIPGTSFDLNLHPIYANLSKKREDRFIDITKLIKKGTNWIDISEIIAESERHKNINTSYFGIFLIKHFTGKILNHAIILIFIEINKVNYLPIYRRKYY